LEGTKIRVVDRVEISSFYGEGVNDLIT
jgi:hypothetical protein